MDWDEVLWHTEHRLGMYVGCARYDRAFSMLTGFDLARGRGELAGFQAWLAERHGGSSLAWPWLILREAFGAEPGEEHLRTDDDHRIAVEHLCLRLRECFGIPADGRRPVTTPAVDDAGR